MRAKIQTRGTNKQMDQISKVSSVALSAPPQKKTPKSFVIISQQGYKKKIQKTVYSSFVQTANWMAKPTLKIMAHKDGRLPKTR